MTDQGFNFSKFIEDSKNALVRPREYFASMPVSGGLGEPVIKALIYGTVAGIFILLWSLLHLSSTGGAFLGIGSAVGVMAFIWSVISALIGLFIGGVIILVISAICSGSTDYEANVRVVAALMVLSPINAFLGFFSGISVILGILIGLLVNLYGIWMLYHALNGSLKAKPGSSKVLAIVLAALVVLFMIIGMGTRSAVKHYGNKLDKLATQYEKMADEYTKSAEKVAEEAGKNVQEAMDQTAEESEELIYQLEMANGDMFDNPGTKTLSKELDNLSAENEHAILSHGDDFIQAAVTDDGFLMEYRDNSGYFASEATNLSKDKVVTVFLLFLKDDPSWKEMITWEKTEK
ncbi:MAG: YIP1 family protein [Chlorobi bacterium]|nr:YIP1 family protein [Chlorobiota bacterium]